MIEDILINRYKYEDEIYIGQFDPNLQNVEFEMRKKIAQMSFNDYLNEISNFHSIEVMDNEVKKFAYEKKIFEKKILNLYPKDNKLKLSLEKFNQKRLYEELLGFLINNDKFNANKVLHKIKNNNYKIIFLILLKIPFSKFFTSLAIHINKTIFLR